MTKILAIYVGQMGLKNLAIGVEKGIWGFKDLSKPEDDIQVDDFVLLASGYTGGNPRVSLEKWMENEIAHGVLGRVTKGSYIGNSDVWPDEKGAVEGKRYRNRVEFQKMQDFQDFDLDDSTCMSPDLAEALRKSACANGRGYLVDATDFPWLELSPDPELRSKIGQLVKKERQEPPGIDPGSVEDARKRIAASLVVREGQAAFRKALLKAYANRCTISGCDAIQALEAAHIHPYKGPETNLTSNGLLLRADIHRLFDLGLISVRSSDMTVLIAPPLQQTHYATLDGKQLAHPVDPVDAPDPALVDYHRSHAGYW